MLRNKEQQNKMREPTACCSQKRYILLNYGNHFKITWPDEYVIDIHKT